MLFSSNGLRGDVTVENVLDVDVDVVNGEEEKSNVEVEIRDEDDARAEVDC